MKTRSYFIYLMTVLCCTSCHDRPVSQDYDAIYFSRDDETAWVGFENPTGGKGAGGSENRGGKGHAFDRILAGDSCELLSIQGPGIIQRIWMTVNEKTPEMLRLLWIKFYWDGESTPAVSAPLGDFFCNGLGRMTTFENCFFSNPEGRSMNVIIPMPFRRSARIVLVNASDKELRNIFYDVDLTRLKKWDEKMLYFHSYWNRENPTVLGKDYTILPEIKGKGRFLGVNVGVIADSVYKDSWWGEGEVKFYLDGDTDYPTLCGTGTEDYIGTGWGQGRYVNRYQGCLIADPQNRMWTFYRFHVPDPVFFHTSCRVTLQQIGGSDYENVLALHQAGAALIPVTINLVEKGLLHLLDKEPSFSIDNPGFQASGRWVNFYRQDDLSSTAYFYLDKPAIK
ncbi:MAG: DUF2961 domain-containing protein [Tannerella sp.]|jgi:hypothetical protein|nr:DUF2961 domain-containing protein [Tannerella sp.]